MNSQPIQEQLRLVEKLKQHTKVLFHQYMSYEINDALTSILAICDQHAKQIVPEVKASIQRINRSLYHTSDYHRQSSHDINTFDIDLVVKNLVRVVKDHFNDNPVHLSPMATGVRVEGDQSAFERIFLLLVTEMISSSPYRTDLYIEVKQKNYEITVALVMPQAIIRPDIIQVINGIEIEHGFEKKTEIFSTERGLVATIAFPIMMNGGNNCQNGVTITSFQTKSKASQ
ncbi:hypothetical protein IPJ72_03850 [Candidatus Peregrinibacteria bacterium]|nr:MAG: hypothetical protein IPJ72_03850 [Candidatus Peregrinibacteria bacterium]